MCFVAAFADAFETIDGMTVILRRPAKKKGVNSVFGGQPTRIGSGRQWEDIQCTRQCVFR